MSKKGRRMKRTSKHPGGRAAPYPDDDHAIKETVSTCAQSLGFRVTVRNNDDGWELTLHSPFNTPGKWQKIRVTWDHHLGALAAQSSRLISKDYAAMLYQRADQEELPRELHQLLSRHSLVDFAVEVVPTFERGKVTPPKGIILQSRLYMDGDKFAVSRAELFTMLSRVEHARREVDSILWRFQVKRDATTQDDDRDLDKLKKMWDAVPVTADLQKLTRMTAFPFGPYMKVAVLIAFDSWVAGVPPEETKEALLREANSLMSSFVEDNDDLEAVVDLVSDSLDAAIEEVQRLQPSISYADETRPSVQLAKNIVREVVPSLIRALLENLPA